MHKRIILWTLVFLVIITYGWTIFFGFSYLDDNVLILDSMPFLKNLSNIPQVFTTDVFYALRGPQAYYRPILTLSFMFDAVFSGTNPFFYHLTNIIYHLLATILVYIFLRKISISEKLSFFFAAVFAVHPVLAQAVAWIPGRNDSLLAIFVLASFIFFDSFLLHLLFFTLALFTKESAIFILPLILFYRAFIQKKKLANPSILWFFSWGIVISLWFILRKVAFTNPINYSLPFVVKSLTDSLPAVLLFLEKIIFPIKLSVLPTLVDSSLIPGIIALLVLAALLLISKGKNLKLILFGTVWFLIFLLPSFIRPDPGYPPDFLEHRVYLSLVGFFMVVSQIKLIKLNKIIGGGVIGLLIIINYLHLPVYKDRLSFWQNAVATSPSHPLAHKNLGSMYLLDGNYAKAITEYQKAISINPQETMVHNNLGVIYMNQGDKTKAEEEFKQELIINPNYDKALNNLKSLLK